MNPETEKWLEKARGRLSVSYGTVSSNEARLNAAIVDLRRFDVLVTEQAEEIKALYACLAQGPPLKDEIRSLRKACSVARAEGLKDAAIWLDQNRPMGHKCINPDNAAICVTCNQRKQEIAAIVALVGSDSVELESLRSEANQASCRAKAR